MIVYLVFTGTTDAGDEDLQGVFSTQEKANKYALHFHFGEYAHVSAWEIDGTE